MNKYDKCTILFEALKYQFHCKELLNMLHEWIANERNALHLLTSLSTSYQSLSCVLLYCDRQIIIYNEVVIARLIDNLQYNMMLSSTPYLCSRITLTVT